MTNVRHWLEFSEFNFEKILKDFKNEYNLWDIKQVYNGSFESVDLESYYSVIRYFKPKKIIEIGSGYCTSFAHLAASKNDEIDNLITKIISIDPSPQRILPNGIEHICNKVEEVNLKEFLNLDHSDILFIDSSHTLQESTYHFDHIIPKLNSGVLIHHHDIFYPFDKRINDENYSEQDLVIDFYKSHPNEYEVLFSCAFIRHNNPYTKILERLVPSFEKDPERIPASFWVQKK